MSDDIRGDSTYPTTYATPPQGLTPLLAQRPKVEDPDNQAQVVLHVADVGQGTAVLIEMRETEGGERKVFLYDGGNRDKRSDSLFDAMRKCCPKGKEGKYVLNGIVVSHTDLDHLGGVVRLLTKKPAIETPIDIKPCPVLLTTAFLKLRSAPAVKDLLGSLASDKYKPVKEYRDDTGKPVAVQDLHQSFHCIFHGDAHGVLYSHEGNPLNNIEEQNPVQKEKVDYVNRSSIILQVNRTQEEIHVSLHGDAHGDQIAPHVENRKVCAFLVSHHGSRKCSMLCEKGSIPSRLVLKKHAPLLASYTILSGKSLATLCRFHVRDWVHMYRFSYKGQSLSESANVYEGALLKIEEVLKNEMSDEDRTKVEEWWGNAMESSHSSPKEFLQSSTSDTYRQVLERYNKVKKMKEFTYIVEILEECCVQCFLSWCYEVECRKFYERFEASTYIITSGGSPHGHPDMEVLNGIALAAVQRSKKCPKLKKCQIVLTNSVGLEFWKFSDVFFEHSDKISVWYLDDDNNLRTKPYISINPLHDPLYEDQSVNSEERKGMTKLQLQTRLQNWEQSMQCLSSRNLLEILKEQKKVDPPDAMGDPYLPDYLKIVGHDGDITLSTLLEYMLGSKIANQISTSYPHPILRDLGWYRWKVKEKSNFFLSATGLAVQFCEIHLDIPELLQEVEGKQVETTVLLIRNIRKKELQLETVVVFKCENQTRVVLVRCTPSLDYNGTCGQPLAEYLAAIGMDCKRCVSMAGDLTVGEVLALLLSSTRATVLMRSFPDFYSTILINYKIDPLQTTIDFQQSNGNVHIIEAHIVAKIPEDETSCMTLAITNGPDLSLQIHKAFFHIFPSYDKTERLLGLSGEVTVNHNWRMTMEATPSFYDAPEMEFTCPGSLKVSEMLSVSDCQTEFQVPFTEQKVQVKDNVSAGFTIQQPFLQAPRISSIFYDVEWFASLPPFWPKSMKVIKEASLRLSLIFPLKFSFNVVGIKARFSCDLTLENKVITLDCSFAATPNTSKDNEYSCLFSLRPSQRPYEELEDVKGAPILDVITALNETVGEGLRTTFAYTWPELVNAIELRELSLQLCSSGSVEGFKLDVGIYDELELIRGKLALSNARLLINYSPGYVQLECEGYLIFFQQYQTFLSFLLPTPDSPGELRFENTSSDFTLERFVNGMFGLGDSISKVPILSEVLSVSINSIHIIFERQGSNTVITHAKVTLTKEELSLGLMKFSSIEITVTVEYINSEYTFDFSISGFIGDVLYARLQYYDSEPTSMLRGDVILASFRELDAISVLKELNVDNLPSPSPLLDNSPGATGHLAVTIQITKQPVSFDLAHVVVNLTNVVQLQNFIVTQLWFEYAKFPDSRIKFFGTLCKVKTGESVALEFTWDKTAITAKVVSGLTPESPGGLLKLSSLLELVKCEKPDIPQIDSSTTFFDLELKSGSISFKPKPIKVTAFEVSVVSHGELCLISEPRIVVSDVTLHAEWNEGAKVNGTISATFRFSSTLVKILCRKDTSDVLLTAKIEPTCKEMNTGTEIVHISQNANFSELIPTEVFCSQAVPLAVAINVTRKQFLFLSKITNFGNGVLFVGKSGFALSISLQDGFRFKDILPQLSFVDDLIKVRSANLAVSSLNGVKVCEFCESISKLTEEFQCEVPFSNLPVSSPDLNQQTLSAGVSIFATMDINQSEDSVLRNIIHIQPNQTSLPDLLIKASVVERSSASGGCNVTIEAHLRELTLLGKLQFLDIGFLYHLSEQESLLKLSGTLHLDFDQSPCDFYGSLTITKSDARFEVEKVTSESPFASPLGMDITLTELLIKANFDLVEKSAPLIELMGSINIGHVDLTAMIILSGFLPVVVVIDITTELSVVALFASLGKSKPSSLMDFKLLKGHFHYATKDTCIEQWMVPKQTHIYRPSVARNRDGSVVYSGGIHVKCDIKILFFKFDIRLDISQDFSSIEISGRSLEKVNLLWIKLTDPEFEEGPVISYSMSSTNPGVLKISVGLEILGKPWFIGTLSYEPGKPYLKGSVEYEGTFLWMENPRIELIFMVNPPYVMISDFSFGKGDKSGSIFNLGKKLKEFCKWLFDLVKKAFSQDFDLHLRTAENPDSKRFSVVFTISGAYKVIFFNSDRATVSLELPQLVVKVPKGFSLGELPNLIVKTLKSAGKLIVTKIVDYIQSRGLLGALHDLAHAAVAVAKKVVTVVGEGVKKVASAVAGGAKAVAKKISGFFSWAFGSIHICDRTGQLIAEIMGGRGGKPLYNEQHVVPLFAPLIGIHGIQHHGEHVHTSGRASLNLPSHWRDDEETEERREERKTTLEALKTQQDELGPHLETLAFMMLKIQNINLAYDHPNRIFVRWEMDSSVMEVDKGDFDYNIKVVASTFAQEVHGLSGSLKHNTIFDERLNHSAVESAPFTLIVDEQEILPHAYRVTVSIQASITMSVKAHDITDDVTVEGEWKHTEIYLKHPSLQAPSSISMHYDDSLHGITGSVGIVSSVQAYIVKLVDADNPSDVIDQVILPQPQSLPPDGCLAYTLNLSELPKNALKDSNAYTVQVQSVGNNNNFSESILSERKCTCQASPINVRLLPSDTDGGCLKVCWNTRSASYHLRGFSLQLYAVLSGSELQEIITLPQIAADDSTTHSYSFRLSEIAEALQSKNIIPHPDSDLLLQCYVYAHGSDCILPSVPACSQECYLLPPPASVQCFYSPIQKSLYVGWKYVSHALSYRIELVNMATDEVTLEYVHYQSTFSWKDNDFEILFSNDYLKRAPLQGNFTYRLQVSTLGHGEDYLGSLEACASTTLLQTLPEDQLKLGNLFTVLGQEEGTPVHLIKSPKMSYTPTSMDESVCLSWEPPQFGGDSYTVSVNDFEKVTSSTEVYLSPMNLGVLTDGEYTVTIIPDSDTQSKCTLTFSSFALFTELFVTARTVTSLSIQYEITPDAPEDMNYYLIVENVRKPNISHSITLHPDSETKVITFHHIQPETKYNLYAVAFSEDCMKWAIPIKIETVSLPAPKEMHLLGRNLLDDPSGADMTMDSSNFKQRATDSSCVEDSWAIEPWTPESKCDPPPLDLPTMYCTAKDASVMRTQVIDLREIGFSPAFLDEHQPDIRVQSWVCAPEVPDSPTYYKMVIKLLSEDQDILAKFQKGPLRLIPNGEWRPAELSVGDYGPHLRYIEFTDCGSSENDNTTRVAGTTVRLGYPPGSCIQVYSLPDRNSFSSSRRTCLVQLSSPNIHTLYESWRVEYSEADPESGKILPTPLQDYYAPMGTEKVHKISFDVPIQSVRLRIFALDKDGMQWRVGEAFLPPAISHHSILERNMLAADMLESRVPLHRVAPDAVILSRAWTDLSQGVEQPWRSECWMEEKILGFDPPPCCSNFVLMKCPKGEEVQRVAQIDLWALGFSPRYLNQYHPDFLAVIQYTVDKNQATFKQELEITSTAKYGSENLVANSIYIRGSDRYSGEWRKLSLHAASQPKALQRYLIVSDKGYGCITASIDVRPLLTGSTAPLIYVANLQSRAVKLRFLDTESIMHTMRQKSPNLLVEYRILQDLGNHSAWSEFYFGLPSELSVISVSKLSPSTMYEFAVTLTDPQKQEEYFNATTSGCTLPAPNNKC